MCLVFFCKQKTAYEMRISDWSSDVCSSDLYATADRPAYDAKSGYAGSQFLMSLSKRYPKYWLGAFARWDSLAGAVFADSPLVKRDHYFAAGEIGRASCRERVCQYV